MRAVTRGAVVLGCSLALAALVWGLAEALGRPTPTPMEPGLHQPAIAGVRHVVQFMGAGALAWTLAWLAARALGFGRKRPRTGA
jgi:hypothetical protein